MVMFGRPEGDRPSYKQWEEGGIPPQVVFGVFSPNNRLSEQVEKLLFRQRFGVEEYYVCDPDTGRLDGWTRREAAPCSHRADGRLGQPAFGYPL